MPQRKKEEITVLLSHLVQYAWPDTTFLPEQPADELIKLKKRKQNHVSHIPIFILLYLEFDLSSTEHGFENVDRFHIIL